MQKKGEIKLLHKGKAIILLGPKTPWATVLQNKYSSQWRNTKEEIVTPKGL